MANLWHVLVEGVQVRSPKLFVTPAHLQKKVAVFNSFHALFSLQYGSTCFAWQSFGMLRLLSKVFQMQSRVSVLLKWRSAQGIAWDGIARLSMNLCHCQDFFSCFAHRYQLLSCGDATVSKMLKCQDRAERQMSFDMRCAFEDVH